MERVDSERAVVHGSHTTDLRVPFDPASPNLIVWFQQSKEKESDACGSMIRFSVLKNRCPSGCLYVVRSSEEARS